MQLIGIIYKETEFEGKRYGKYFCQCVDSRRFPGLTGKRVHVYEVKPNALEKDFEFKIDSEYDFAFDDEGKVIGVFEI